MLYLREPGDPVEAVEFSPGMEDGIELRCSRNERCEYQDDGYCFDSPGQCEYQRFIPYITTDSTGVTEQGYPKAGEYIVTIDDYRKKIISRKEFVAQYSLYAPEKRMYMGKPISLKLYRYKRDLEQEAEIGCDPDAFATFFEASAERWLGYDKEWVQLPVTVAVWCPSCNWKGFSHQVSNPGTCPSCARGLLSKKWRK